MSATAKPSLIAKQSIRQPSSQKSYRPVILSQSIPPERVGLDGQYDHSGLAKRVRHVLKRAFGSSQRVKLHVAQRGRVAVFSGEVSNQELLRQAVTIAMKVEGIDFVETRGVVVQN